MCAEGAAGVVYMRNSGALTPWQAQGYGDEVGEEGAEGVGRFCAAAVVSAGERR